MSKIEADKQVSIKLKEEKTERIKVQEEQKSIQKKCDVGISWGDAFKTFAPIVIAIVDGFIDKATTVKTPEEEYVTDEGNVSEKSN